MASNGNLVVGCGIGRSVRIGRSVVVTVVGVGMDGQVQLAIEAPQTFAISRDGYPYDVHMQHQLARERGERITDDMAYRRAGRRR